MSRHQTGTFKTHQNKPEFQSTSNGLKLSSLIDEMAIYSVECKPVFPFTVQISARAWLLLISMVERECGKIWRDPDGLGKLGCAITATSFRNIFHRRGEAHSNLCNVICVAKMLQLIQRCAGVSQVAVY